MEQSRTFRTLIVIAVTSPEYSVLIEGKCNGPVSPVMSLLDRRVCFGPQKKEARWFLIEWHLRRYRPSPRSKRQRTRKATVRERVSSPTLMKVFPLWVPA